MRVIGNNRAVAPLDLPLRCRCGRVCGVASKVAPSSGFRFICYCRDCQAFARFLERMGVLDAVGGTDIFQMPTGRVKLSAGADAVRCLRFSDKVFRWYTDCCHTPIGNTAGPRFPVVGIIYCFMSPGTIGRFRDEVLGPPLCRVYVRSATGPLPRNALAPATFLVCVHRASKSLAWWVRGLGSPNPFFDDRTKAPRSAPRVFTPSERAALDSAA